jgi:hypothetical protein
MVDVQLNKASSFSFELTLPVIPSQRELAPNEELTLNIFDTIIPGLTLGLEENRWQGAKTTHTTGVMDFNQWNVNFGIDVDFKNWKMLFKWLTLINNNKDRYIKRHSEYTVDSTLLIMDNFKNNVFSLKFIDVWPISLGDVTLNYREGESNLECLLTLSYDRYELVDDIDL